MWTFPGAYPGAAGQNGYPNPGQGYPQMPQFPQVGQLAPAQMLAAQGNYGQPGVMPAGYPYPYHMMPGYAPPPPAGKTGKGAAAAGEPPAKGSRKRRKRIPQGGPKKPATSFVLFSNTVREQVKEENPGLSFLDLGRKLGEMWREMEPQERKEYEDKANEAKERYLEEKKVWLAQRAAGMTGMSQE